MSTEIGDLKVGDTVKCIVSDSHAFNKRFVITDIMFQEKLPIGCKTRFYSMEPITWFSAAQLERIKR